MGGGKDTHVNRLGGAGVQHAEQCGRAEIKSLYTLRGKGHKEFLSPSKARLVLGRPVTRSEPLCRAPF
jgi:hypothetical protein